MASPARLMVCRPLSALRNYTRLLRQMGRSDAEIAAEHRAMMRDAGLA